MIYKITKLSFVIKDHWCAPPAPHQPRLDLNKDDDSLYLTNTLIGLTPMGRDRNRTTMSALMWGKVWGKVWGVCIMGSLTAVAIKNAKPGRYHDGDGLFLDRTSKGGRWIYRYAHLGKRRDMGLGSYPAISLAKARLERDKWKLERAAGNDPIAIRKAAQEVSAAERDRADPTFEELTMIVFNAKKAKLRGGGTRGRWLSPFKSHIFKAIGNKRASSLTAHDIRDALKPLWHDKHPTAEKAFQRTRLVLREGRLMEFDVDPVIVDRAVRMLGEVNHIPTPIPATPWQEIPALFARLPKTNGGQCLRLMILTGVRLDGCAGSRQQEFENGVWTIPAERVKGAEGKVRDFRVPISDAVADLVREQSEYFEDLLFPGDTGAAITSRALEICLDKLDESGRPHGFRTSFRTWVQDSDACSWEVAETILNHQIGNKVERSYARSDLLERRAPVMASWASFVLGESAADVVPING